jgi:hypothetical protein
MYYPLLQAVASPRLHKSCSQSGTGGHTRNGSHDLKLLILILNFVKLKAVFPASFLKNLCTVLTGILHVPPVFAHSFIRSYYVSTFQINFFVSHFNS